MSDKPLILVDGSSYLYRAFHALPELTNPAGEPTGAMHGVLNMLRRLIADYQPDRMAVVFDAPGKTFRDELYADYKATRPKMPDDLRAQIEPLLESIEAMGMRVIRIQGVEADDVIGTLAAQAEAQGIDTVISTGDKDMAQLVSRRIGLVNTMNDASFDSQAVKERYGVTPEQFIDYLTLAGDSSDNIPGVPGVGPKTAAKWLEQYGTLDGLIAHADEIGGKAGERLRDAIGDLPLYKELVTIKRDVEIPQQLAALEILPPDEKKLRVLHERFQLRALIRDLDDTGTEPPPRETRYETVFTKKDLDTWLKQICEAQLTALDTETTSLNYMQAELVGISLATETGRAAYIPLAHRYTGAPDQLDREWALKKLKPWLESGEHKKVGHHLKYDTHIFKNHGIELAGVAFDTMLESYVLNSTATRHDMNSVAAKYLDIHPIKYEEVAGKGAKQLRFDEVEVEAAARYAAEDADICLAIHEKLWPEIAALGELEQLYADLEQPLARVLQKMEYTGVKIDTVMLGKQSRALARKIAEAENAAHELAGGPFNLSSPKQLQQILFEELGLPVLGKTPKGQPSTAESVLQELAEEYELPQRILEYRALAKLKSTYTDKLPKEVNPATGRVHTSYHQAVAATGRLSSSDPNLQNIPIRTAEGRKIRQAFVAPDGYRLIAADYSQIELRIMAHLSGDEGLLDAFRKDLDIHSSTAAEVFGVALDAVDADQRRSAKAINFGLIYGMSAFGLGRQLGIMRGEAQDYIDVYFERYPGVKQYMEDTRELARKQGYVSTVYGRRLYLPEINARNAQRRQYAERSAINAPMQGTAADIIKRAMLEVDAWLDQDGIDGRLIMQVHDELVLEISKAQVEAASAKLIEIMEAAAELKVPLKVDAGVGANWDEAH